MLLVFHGDMMEYIINTMIQTCMYIYIYIHVIIIDMYGVGQLDEWLITHPNYRTSVPHFMMVFSQVKSKFNPPLFSGHWVAGQEKVHRSLETPLHNGRPLIHVTVFLMNTVIFWGKGPNPQCFILRQVPTFGDIFMEGHLSVIQTPSITWSVIPILARYPCPHEKRPLKSWCIPVSPHF